MFLEKRCTPVNANEIDQYMTAWKESISSHIEIKFDYSTVVGAAFDVLLAVIRKYNNPYKPQGFIIYCASCMSYEWDQLPYDRGILFQTNPFILICDEECFNKIMSAYSDILDAFLGWNKAMLNKYGQYAPHLWINK